jgi:hypothetical protein
MLLVNEFTCYSPLNTLVTSYYRVLLLLTPSLLCYVLATEVTLFWLVTKLFLTPEFFCYPLFATDLLNAELIYHSLLICLSAELTCRRCRD